MSGESTINYPIFFRKQKKPHRGQSLGGEVLDVGGKVSCEDVLVDVGDDGLERGHACENQALSYFFRFLVAKIWNNFFTFATSVGLLYIYS